jgi:polar amino acid transport system substrate-binding protein
MKRREFIALAGAASAAAAFPRIALAQQAVVNVGFSYSSPSWSWYDVVSGINNGFMLDLMIAVGKDAGFQVQFHGAILADLPSLLSDRKIDAISTVFTPAFDPQRVADFSIPVWVYGEALMIKKTDKTDYRSIQDLRGKSVSPGVFGPQLRASGVPMNISPTVLSTVETIDGMRNGIYDLATYTSPLLPTSSIPRTIPT